MGYDLEGRMAEVCTCKTYCPCWGALDPDGGSCDFSWIFHIDRGHINGVEVAGLNMGFLGQLPGNPMAGNVRLLVVVDAAASEAQHKALLDAFTGQAGGPLADLAGLVGEVVAVERAPIEFDVHEGSGTFRVGGRWEGEVQGQRASNGNPTKLVDAALSPVLGTPAYPGHAVRFQVTAAEHGYDFPGRSATQTEFHHVVA
ncbi:DUF1326 domain-containing protein [Pseudonocardia abyssalis]|jgi:hypothetical protein|uniref:DUF1326 domain-containing protein n=1 Tax=Pseudonocardia abyssalis TaxID=2792008 RepID=A0ABS6V275_9PSEU|nr:DUF1326 domain-containing protein [Pseudonocardia abyssalis]MBW0114456.1 DUF1326 domain-containing protein [Pseudonocardia abyssalis]MBW0138607.1 DUF1326 domain-containing protein [Pseudonocardia abyssalis]